MAVAFVPLDGVAHDHLVFVTHPGQVGFHAHVAVACHQRAEPGMQAAARCVAPGRPDMRAHHFGRQKIGKPGLNSRPFDRVIAVRGPEPVGALEDLVIDAAATGSAAFDLQLGKRCAQPVEQRVERARLAVHGRPSRGIAGQHQVAVHVPFQVGNVMIADQLGQALEQILADIWIGDVEHQLVAPGQSRVVAQPQHPVGVVLEQLGLLIDHFRFYPEAKFHPQ